MTDFQDSASAHEEESSGVHSQFRTRLAQEVDKLNDLLGNNLRDLRIPSSGLEIAVGTVLGAVTIRAFTKAWPRLRTPVNTAGYLVGSSPRNELIELA